MMLITSASIVSGEAPGYSARTLTMGRSTSGSSRISTDRMAARPASRIRRLSTSTSTGLRMLMLGRSLITSTGTSSPESFSASGLSSRSAISIVGCGARTTRVVACFGETGGLVTRLDSFTDPLHGLDDDQVAFLEFRIHQYLPLLALDDGYRYTVRPAFLDRPHVSTVRAPLHAGFGNHGIWRALEVEPHPEAHARTQLVRFVLHPGTRDKRAGHGIDAAAYIDDHAVGCRLPALPGRDFHLVADGHITDENLRHLETHEERAPVVQRGDHGVRIDPVAGVGVR